MAFCSRSVGVLRQNTSGNVQSPLTSMLNSVRCISSKLFVGGLSYATDDLSLRNAFSGYGDIIEAKVACHEITGKSKGFGFVTFNNLESASSAISSMDGQELQGRKVNVKYFYERGGPRTFGGGSLFGGYDGCCNLENPEF